MKLRFFLILAVLIIGGLLVKTTLLANNSQNEETADQAQLIVPTDREEIINIESGMTFSIITETAGLDAALAAKLLSVAEPVYDLALIKAGKPIKFYFDYQTGELNKVIYQIDSESELALTKADNEWQATVEDIAYEIKIKTVSGTIDSSLYESGLEQNIDERAILELADVFAWTVDFAMGIRAGDTYKFIYEERYRQGEYVMPGKIIAAKFVNDGKVVEGYYFSEGENGDGELVEGYYHPDGQSVMKMFLKNPVNYKYITSGYTTGQRYVSAFNVSTGHRAIDYAAAVGTPIRSVGDGTVVSAGWSSQGYGNLTSIRHNSIYSTNYAHQSKILVKVGQKVSQGEVIGKVGSTGFSTGPHLHFEMVKNGTKINPLTVDLPADKAVSEEQMPKFLESIKSWQDQLADG